MDWFWIVLILIIILVVIIILIYFFWQNIYEKKTNQTGPGLFGRKSSQYKVCVASRNGTFGSAVSDYVNSYILEPSYQRDMKACSKVITGKVNERSNEDFEGAPLVMFVAIAEPRMLFVSKTEESQLGPVYEQALRLHKSIFMVIAGHAESDDLSDDEAYSEKSLTDVVKSQPALQDLIEKNRLVSVGYTHSPTQLCFNSKQRDQIKDWINKDLRSQNLY